jgi:AraC-like DNA-binding protein
MIKKWDEMPGPWALSTGQTGYEREAYEGATQLLPELAIFGWLHFHNSLPGALKRDAHRGEYEIHYFRRGHLRWWVEEDNYELNPHSLLIVRPGEMHGGENNTIQPCEHYWLRFSFPKKDPLPGLSLAETLRFKKDFEQLSHRLITASQDVNQFFEYLLHEHRRREMPDAQQMARLMFHALLIAILRDHQQFAVATKQKPMLTWRIRKVQELIKERLDQQDLDIEQIAGVLKISASGLRTRFKCETQETMHEYWIRQRIEQAKMLLRQTDQSIIDIAIQLGFASSQYFSTVFRKHVGIMPTEYRKLEL